ncbi:carboxylic ester hydrolase [Catellatospora sp. TT07R-123]|uniref:carboxylesterase/lipase family protein n=1 Tax=Catellatospora sp. TT07R-123 TaxID=2733863 RepID=UPI001B0A5692|nr:carboxylesterase family protein [Catellatospora sp. TT07R-123]GHJ45585.1 carboxylic ester hydrolase [Catellatospora sp. TT07R-123]
MTEIATEAIVATRAGRVRGRLSDGIAVFLGIPYAAAPFGEHRFRRPARVQPWDGVRDALAYGPTAPKAPFPPPMDRLLADPDIPGTECLNLNVWAPADGSGCPVMVWIHGGSLRNGSSCPPAYDGSAFARDGVVLVSFNYRLGVEGFGVFPDAPTNLGLRDQLAALEWVRENIAAFGGDPGNVTVFGESAGSISIGALLTSPYAEGLFRRAVLQSGAPTAQSREGAARSTRAVARRLRVPATAAAFAAVDPKRLLDAQAAVSRSGAPIGNGIGFTLAVDGDTVPADPLSALHAGAAAGIDVMLGYNAEEYRLWFVPTGMVEKINGLTLRLALAKFRVPGRTAKVYREAWPQARPGELLGIIATDRLLRLPLNRLADARLPARTWLYEFAWQSPVEQLGACHALEIGFVFDTLASSDGKALAGDAPPQALADTMHRAWVAFAATGDPGWPAWDPTRPVMRFDAPTSAVVHAPRAAELAAWA